VCGRDLGKLDWAFYEKPGYDPDYSGGPFHSKMCSYLERERTNSWTCDRRDPLYVDPAADDEIFLAYGNAAGKYTVVGSVMAKHLQGLWKPAKTLKHKVAIYLEDIKDEGLIRFAPGSVKA